MIGNCIDYKRHAYIGFDSQQRSNRSQLKWRAVNAIGLTLIFSEFVYILYKFFSRESLVQNFSLIKKIYICERKILEKKRERKKKKRELKKEDGVEYS